MAQRATHEKENGSIEDLFHTNTLQQSCGVFIKNKFASSLNSVGNALLKSYPLYHSAYVVRSEHHDFTTEA